jgi:hypothetical protein
MFTSLVQLYRGCGGRMRVRAWFLLNQVGVTAEEAGGGVAREAVVTVAAGGVGGGVEDISAFAARGPARAADEARPARPGS